MSQRFHVFNFGILTRLSEFGVVRIGSVLQSFSSRENEANSLGNPPFCSKTLAFK